MFKIENDVPVPSHGNVKYPFSKMEVGESFDIGDTNVLSVGSAARMFGCRTGTKFSIKKHEGSHRCWRVS